MLDEDQQTGPDTHLTECIHEMDSESQLPRKIVNLWFTITDQNKKSTILWGS